MDESQSSVAHKIVLVGGTAVGKTSVLDRFIKQTFVENTTTTIHAYCVQKQVIAKNQTVILDIWDTAGQERFRSIGPLFYRNAQLCIAIFDSSMIATFDAAHQYIDDFLDAVPDGFVLFAANKLDLVDPEKLDDFFSETKLKAKTAGYDIYYISAKTGEGVDELFTGAADKILESKHLTEEVADIKPVEKQSDCC